MKRILLTTATCDNYYLDVLKVFLVSMRLNSRCNETICADLINGTPDIYYRLKNIYENLTINHIAMPSVDWIVRENLLPLMYKRLPRMYETMNVGYDQIMTIDCDSIVRGPIDGIWDGVEPDTIKILERPSARKEKKKRFFTRFQAGIHIFGNSTNIRKYYKAFMDELGDRWEFKSGQAAIYTVYLKFKDKIRLVQMPEKYNDSTFKEDSIIWHCKFSHFAETPFQNEFKNYLTEANRLYK